MSIERIVGIDFGTSTSLVKVKTYKDNEPLGLRNSVEYVHFDNKDSLPTLVYKTFEDKYLIGYEAENAAVKGVLYQNFKMNLISPDETLRKEAITYTEIFFKYMFEAYDTQKSHYPSCDIETTYVSYPAKWPAELRNLMVSIATKAGFNNVKGLDEPTAAIHTVLVQESEKLVLCGEDYADILMIDMGAGTTDLVLCRYNPFEEKHIEVLNTWPKADSSCLFGGREVDEALCEYIKAYLTDCGLPNTKNFNEKYLDKCKKWKDTNLSPIYKEETGVVKYCGFVDSILAMLDIDKDFPPMSRKEFEDMLSDYLKQYPKMINDCLSDINYDPDKLDYIILTGGHSQWYFANEILEGKLIRFGTTKLSKVANEGTRIIKMSRPQETVALGLVYQKIVIKQLERPSIKVTGVINLIAGKYLTKYGVDLLADEISLKRLEEAAKKCVTELESCEQTELNIPYVSANSNGPVHVNEVITRNELTAFVARYKEDQTAQGKTEQLKDCTCAGCGKAIPANAAFCGFCGTKNIPIPQKPAASAEIFCTQCGMKILATDAFCGFCGAKVKDIPTPQNSVSPPVNIPRPQPNPVPPLNIPRPQTNPVTPLNNNEGHWPIVIARESQFICAAVSYKVLVNGFDFGNISVGQTKVVSSKSHVAIVEILCTTIMLTSYKMRLRLQLQNNTRISIKIEYPGAIIPTVQGAVVLEMSRN